MESDDIDVVAINDPFIDGEYIAYMHLKRLVSLDATSGGRAVDLTS